MNAQESQERQARSENLTVLKSEDGRYFVESSDGKVLYHVSMYNENFACTCPDYRKNVKNDAEFACKHIMAVMDSEDLLTAKLIDKHQPQLDQRFIKNIKGKEFVLYAGVLDLATQRGLKKLDVELLQSPTKENGMEAVCKATAVSKSGKVFSDYGDANPGNTAELIAKHLIRMASTRAKGRALRDMCNIGMACLEELGEFEEAAPAKGRARSERRNERVKKNQPAVKTPPTAKNTQADQKKMSEAQARAIHNLAKRKKIEKEALDKMVLETFGCALGSLSFNDAGALIQHLQEAA